MNRFSALLLLLISFVFIGTLQAQNPLLRRIPGGGSFRGGGSAGGGDSLSHRTGLEDSVTITARYLDTSRYNKLDSNFTDFYLRYPIPMDYVYLGNTGNAARPIVYSPIKRAGWDAGFHAFDIYQFTIPETKFFNTTRPYSEIGYLLGSKSEQMINVLHTQNITPDWNVAFQYRMINAPGYFKSQNTNHNNYRINSAYQSKNRRYHLFFALVNNKIQSAENGGISDSADYINDAKTYSNRITVPVGMVDSASFTSTVFSSSIKTGNKYRNFSFFLRQQYDLGRKDSIVTDSSVIPLFYPKVRAEHTIRYTSYQYAFSDATTALPVRDSFYYRNYDQRNSGAVLLQDKWKEIYNDFSLYQFPDEKNSQQFFKIGASLQNLQGNFNASSTGLYNISAHAEYRNKTRNQKWDIEANGELYLAGYNAGNYLGVVSLKRYISRQLGYLTAGFQNINRTPSFIFEPGSSFNLSNSSGFNNENITNIFATIEQPIRNLRLSGNYYLITNYTYFTEYYKAQQSAPLFNLLQITADKKFNITRHWKLYSNATIQQKAGAVDLNVPLFFTTQRINYEGNLGFKNLGMAVGAEFLYHTPYKADGYSPVTGQFFYQDRTTISLKRPEINAYFHFRIKRFTAYVRTENLNTLRVKEKFGFTNNNFAAPNYAYPGMVFRLGIFWVFVN